MPKARITKHTVFARNEETALIERIDISPETRQKYANIGKPRKVVRPRNIQKVITPVLSLEERLNLLEETNAEMAEKHLMHDLVMERRKLINRINNPPNPLPLLERLGPAPQEYQPPDTHLEQLKFHRTAILLRIQEFAPMLTAVKVRLDPFFDVLRTDDDDNGTPYFTPEVRTKLWNWWTPFQELYTEWERVGHKLTNKEFREIRGALKRIEKVYHAPFGTDTAAYVEFGEKLAELNLSFPTVSD